MYARTLETIIPVEREPSQKSKFASGYTARSDSDIEVLRWLTRESFDRKASEEWLTITAYREFIVAAEDIPPKAAKQLGQPVEDFVWYGFAAEVVRDASRL